MINLSLRVFAYIYFIFMRCSILYTTSMCCTSAHLWLHYFNIIELKYFLYTPRQDSHLTIASQSASSLSFQSFAKNQKPNPQSSLDSTHTHTPKQIQAMHDKVIKSRWAFCFIAPLHPPCPPSNPAPIN